MVTGPLSGHVLAMGPALGLFPHGYPVPSLPLSQAMFLGQVAPTPSLEMEGDNHRLPTHLPSAFLPTGHSGVASGQPRHLEDPACSFPLCKQVLHDSCGGWGQASSI